MPLAVSSMSTSSKTSTGALPPSSRWTRLRSGAAEAETSMPARSLPVTEISRGMGCATRGDRSPGAE